MRTSLLIAAALLARTLAAAQSIDKKAQTIAGNAGNIDVATNSVIQLNRTNEVAASILQSAKPLQGLLNTTDATARDIDGLAKSINSTAGTINGSAGTINGTATTLLSLAGFAGNSVLVVPAMALFCNRTRELSATFVASAWCAGVWIAAFVIVV